MPLESLSDVLGVLKLKQGFSSRKRIQHYTFDVRCKGLEGAQINFGPPNPSFIASWKITSVGGICAVVTTVVLARNNKTLIWKWQR